MEWTAGVIVNYSVPAAAISSAVAAERAAAYQASLGRQTVSLALHGHGADLVRQQPRPSSFHETRPRFLASAGSFMFRLRSEPLVPSCA
jgi:hypothetical protein